MSVVFFLLFFFIETCFVSLIEVGVLAKQYLEQGLLVPDHVITSVMMMELEKKQSQHWLLDGQ